jgi:hypothetical protein
MPFFFHGGNTGSNPVGDANNPKSLSRSCVFIKIRDHDEVTIKHRGPAPHSSTLPNSSEKIQIKKRAVPVLVTPDTALTTVAYEGGNHG